MTPRYATRTPSRGGTSFQKFRADSLELSLEERAIWDYLTLPPLGDDDGFDAERMLPHDEYRVLSKATSGGGFMVPTDLASKVTAASRAASPVAQLAQITVVTAAVGSTTKYTLADLKSVVKSLPAAYRQNASFLIAADDLAELATTGDTGGLVFPSLGFDPPSLLGFPVFLSGYLPAPAANAKSLVFGDFKIGYGVRRVNGVSIQRQDELHSDLGQIGFRGWSRVDGRVLIADALRILAHSAT